MKELKEDKSEKPEATESEEKDGRKMQTSCSLCNSDRLRKQEGKKTQRNYESRKVAAAQMISIMLFDLLVSFSLNSFM